MMKTSAGIVSAIVLTCLFWGQVGAAPPGKPSGIPPGQDVERVSEQKLNPKQKDRLAQIRGQKENRRAGAVHFKKGFLLDKRGPKDKVRFDLFEDTSVEMATRKVGKMGPTNIWEGGNPEGDTHATMVFGDEGVMIGTIRDKGKLYRVRPMETPGLHSVQEVNEAVLIEHGDKLPEGGGKKPDKGEPQGPPIRNGSLEGDPADQGHPKIVATGYNGQMTTIRVLVAYTPKVQAKYLYNFGFFTYNGLPSLVNLAITESNQAFQNTYPLNGWYKIQFQLAGMVKVNYNETSSFDTDLSRLRGTSDGYMDNVHAIRNSTKADVVVLLRSSGEYCGLGYLYASQSNAFSVTAENCATGYYSFAHEIGHNVGLHHDQAVANNSYFSYGHGFVSNTTGGTYNGPYRTIMAYGNACNGCPRKQIYSSKYAWATPVRPGTSTANNEAVWRVRGDTVAAFR